VIADAYNNADDSFMTKVTVTVVMTKFFPKALVWQI
jgi:hypothetical protein